ncbi:FAD binding domain-containing protein [Pseudonocardia sp.]|uniref:FAD binding domain-containing protein n=1 Tax=Pseudonocardia sp. TaxID=60912 RepID=UPI003D0B9BA4
MDLAFVTDLRRPSSRAELGELGPGVAVLAGGTWLYSEPQDHVHTLVDLTGLGWEPLVVTDGITVGATCTLAELAASGIPLATECCGALAGSFKIWNTATAGGNVCLGLPAGPVIALAAALDGVAVIWTADGGERRMPVARFVLGDRRTALARGEVLRAIELPAATLSARVAFRRAALSAEGRSGSVVIGRVDPDGTFVLTVTAAVERPHRVAFPGIPTASELVAALDGVERWFEDPHGAPDWRRAVTEVLALEIREELA